MAQSTPPELPDDFQKAFDDALECLEAYTQLVCPHFDDESYETPDDVEIGNYLAAVKAIDNLDLGKIEGLLFGREILREMSEARAKFTGHFKPEIEFKFPISTPIAQEFDSAFEFVMSLTYAAWAVIELCDVNFVPLLGDANDENDHLLEAYCAADRALAFFLGSLRSLPYVEGEEIEAELEREVRAAAALRLAGKSWFAADIPNGTDSWSEPASPAEWAKRFNMSWDTLKARIQEGKIRAQKLSSKSYRIRRDHLPDNA